MTRNPAMVTIKTYANDVLGTITAAGTELRGSNTATQSIADDALRKSSSPEAALQRLDGYQNGYIFISADPEMRAS